MSSNVIIALTTIAFIFISGFSYKLGQQNVLIELDKQNALVLELEKQNHKMELEYTSKIKDLENEINNSEVNYSNSINELNKHISDGMLESERRAEYYRRQAESCSSKSKALADYTAKLDRQLTEGVYLVRELTELIKYRDKQLEQVGNQLRLDRELINK